MPWQRSQQSEYRQQYLPEIDHRLAVWQAYLNCVNSFQGIDMIAGADPDNPSKTLSFSRTTQERFCYSLGILDELVDEDKDEDFFKDKPHSLAELLDMNQPDGVGRFANFSQYFRYWGRLDKLMRRQGFYTTRKNVSHL